MFTSNANNNNSNLISLKLANTLRIIGNQKCLRYAEKLSLIRENDGFYFGLRDANINQQDAILISKVLTNSNKVEQSRIELFSLSYNSKIGDYGAQNLIGALPHSVRELGLVGCSIGDQCTKALSKFIRRSNHIKIMCIENNKFNFQSKETLIQLASRKGNLMLVI